MVTKFIVAAALAVTFANPVSLVADTVSADAQTASASVVQIAVSTPVNSTVGAIG